MSHTNQFPQGSLTLKQERKLFPGSSLKRSAPPRAPDTASDSLELHTLVAGGGGGSTLQELPTLQVGSLNDNNNKRSHSSYYKQGAVSGVLPFGR